MTEPQRCKNCKEWRRSEADFGDRMLCKKLSYDCDNLDGVRTCGCCDEVYPGPEFCCIHWTAKEGNDDD